MRSDDWHLTRDVQDFLARAGDFLAARPAPHTALLTVTDRLRREGSHAFGGSDPLFGVLETDGEAAAALLCTPPYWLNVTTLTEERAEALVGRLVSEGHLVPGVSSSRETADAFAGAWQRHTGAEAKIRYVQRLYRLGELTAPDPAPAGVPRIATAADRDQVARWHEEFCESIGEPGGQDAGVWADFHISYGGVTLWETPDGTPVSMAAVTREVAGQVRVANVYTPASLRGHGYAGAVTAEASRVARASGAQEVLLFTDLANPTSNGLYQRLGYRAVTDFAVHEFVEGAG